MNFTGKLTKAEWIKLSNDYNVFINTTDIDNTPLSVIEAMALGLPIVSTDVGGLTFLIENDKDGILVPRQDAGAMVDSIIKLKSDTSLKNKLITNARSKVEKFDWSTTKHKWLDLLN